MSAAANRERAALRDLIIRTKKAKHAPLLSDQPEATVDLEIPIAAGDKAEALSKISPALLARSSGAREDLDREDC